jgi:hypothetical protein
MLIFCHCRSKTQRPKGKRLVICRHYCTILSASYQKLIKTWSTLKKMCLIWKLLPNVNQTKWGFQRLNTDFLHTLLLYALVSPPALFASVHLFSENLTRVRNELELHRQVPALPSDRFVTIMQVSPPPGINRHVIANIDIYLFLGLFGRSWTHCGKCKSQGKCD